MKKPGAKLGTPLPVPVPVPHTVLEELDRYREGTGNGLTRSEAVCQLVKNVLGHLLEHRHLGKRHGLNGSTAPLVRLFILNAIRALVSSGAGARDGIPIQKLRAAVGRLPDELFERALRELENDGEVRRSRRGNIVLNEDQTANRESLDEERSRLEGDRNVAS